MFHSPRNLNNVIETERMRGHTIAFVNGCFDLFHAGHASMLAQAKREADIVVVAIDSDARVRELKGPGRPLFPLTDRWRVLACVRMVDYVTWFASVDELLEVIDIVKPDVMVKGRDYQGKEIVGADRVGKIVFADVTHSSTLLVDRLNSSTAGVASSAAQPQPREVFRG